ncbi:FAD-dependent oxidoreductase domain-containing protein 2-like [Stylophora pistillata]|uniref:FAD-dependent oxidoreductase domain-containing protein 2-like n=1 Tax=Stylophora pistillata TaxID=50429 RepID=UPI000C03CA53|nr:FAD-dependent oxidoreductase domain-containing protein 2-like [Stylophora pistillata]
MNWLTSVVAIFVSCLSFAKSTGNAVHHEYCVVGAGPGGLQLGFYLERAGRDYIIFERDALAGAFYTKYPRHRKLISINKRHTGKTNKEFNMRHDWNSLLSDDESLLMTKYSKQFFPDADILVRYLNDYATKLKLKVQYNTNILHVSRHGEGDAALFHLKDQNDTDYTCKNLVISTGIAVENLPRKFKGFEYTESYSEMSTNPDDYEGQTVLIIGRGNSAFETADSIMGATNLIHMFARSRVRLSWETHYVGDLRAVNNGILDTYQLKSLDALLEAPIEEMAVIKRDGKLFVDAFDGSGENIVTADQPISESGRAPDNFAVREPYDRIIRCLGFKFDFSIFDNTTKPRPSRGKRSKKYPAIKPSYESTSIPRLYFAGTNTHSVDFRKSAGGFIHGFRYTARTLHRVLEWRNHKVVWPHVTVAIAEVVNVILRRINEASGIYQMFGVLGEVMILRDNGKVEYYEEFPIRLVHQFEEFTGRPAGPMIVLNMEYGKDFSGAGKDTFKADRATGEPGEAHKSNFLHPVLYFYKEPPTALPKETKEVVLPRPDRIHHMVEDFLTQWTAPNSHMLPLRRFIENVVQSDLRSFFASTCFKIMMTQKTAPINCQGHYTEGPMLPTPKHLRDTLLQSQAEAKD